jgi:hypothetical protein
MPLVTMAMPALMTTNVKVAFARARRRHAPQEKSALTGTAIAQPVHAKTMGFASEHAQLEKIALRDTAIAQPVHAKIMGFA